MNIQAMIQANMTPWQNVRPLWWPIELRLGAELPHAYVALPGGHWLSYGLEPDYDERLVAQWGPFYLSRQETEAEREEREEAWAEEAFLEREANRYTEWYY